MKAKKKNPLTGAMMDVTKVHFSLFFLPIVKGTLSSFTPLKSETQLLSLVQQTCDRIHQHYFFFFFAFLILIMMSGEIPLLPNRHFDFGTSNTRDALTMSFP